MNIARLCLCIKNVTIMSTCVVVCSLVANQLEASSGYILKEMLKNEISVKYIM